MISLVFLLFCEVYWFKFQRICFVGNIALESERSIRYDMNLFFHISDLHEYKWNISSLIFVENDSDSFMGVVFIDLSTLLQNLHKRWRSINWTETYFNLSKPKFHLLSKWALVDGNYSRWPRSENIDLVNNYVHRNSWQKAIL